MQKHLVVARFAEDVSWVVSADVEGVFLYNKGQTPCDVPVEEIRLPNVGRESHTYLHHIVQHYRNLPEWLICCQGDPFPHCFNFLGVINKDDPEKMWREVLHAHPNSDVKLDGYMGLGPSWVFYMDFDDRESKRFLRWAGWGHKLEASASYGANFVVHRKNILSKPVQVYRQLLRMHDEYYGMPWIMEKSFPWLFTRRVAAEKSHRCYLH